MNVLNKIKVIIHKLNQKELERRAVLIEALPYVEPPKRGSAPYWRHVALKGFISPTIFISAFLIAMFVGLIQVYVAFVPFFVIIPSFFIARRLHKKLMEMSDEEYEKSFQPKFDPYEELRNPAEDECQFDQTSPDYWIIGPGSKRNINN